MTVTAMTTMTTTRAGARAAGSSTAEGRCRGRCAGSRAETAEFMARSAGGAGRRRRRPRVRRRLFKGATMTAHGRSTSHGGKIDGGDNDGDDSNVAAVHAGAMPLARFEEALSSRASSATMLDASFLPANAALDPNGGSNEDGTASNEAAEQIDVVPQHEPFGEPAPARTGRADGARRKRSLTNAVEKNDDGPSERAEDCLRRRRQSHDYVCDSVVFGHRVG